MEGPDRVKWQAAIEEMIKELDSHHTWDLVKPPPNRKILKGKWVYKIKTNAKGEVERYKAR